MDFRHRYHVLVFIYQYLAILYLVLTAVVATGGAFRSILFFGIALTVGYLVVRFRLKYQIKKEENQTSERRCHLFVLIIALVASIMYLAQMEEFGDIRMNANPVGIILLCIWLFSAAAVYLYADYFHEKYLTMYANPSVSTETIRRFEKNTWRVLRKKAMVFGGIVLVVVALFLNIDPATVERDSSQPEPQTQTRQAAPRKVAKQKKMKAKEVAEKAERGPFMEILGKVLGIFMRVVIVVLFVLAITGILYLIIRKFLRFKIPAFQLVEEEEKRTEGNDEYIPLRPHVRKKAVFPADNNGVIRKFFYEHIKKEAKGSVDMSLTPWEMEEKYGAEEKEHLSTWETTLVRLYEKARYSGKMCLDEEVEQIKKKK